MLWKHLGILNFAFLTLVRNQLQRPAISTRLFDGGWGVGISLPSRKIRFMSPSIM
jgi:hypothetical protein